MGWHLRRLLSEEEAERKYPDRVLICRLLKLALRYKRYFAALVVTTSIRIVLSIYVPYTTKFLIDSALAKDIASLAFWSLAFLILALSNWAVGFVSSYSTSYLGSRLMYDLRNSMYRHLHRVKLSVVVGEPVGKLVSRLTNDVDTVGNVATSGLLETIADVITIGGAMFMMWSLSPQLSLVCYLLIPLTIVANAYFIRKAREAYRETRRRIAEVTSRISQDIAGASVVQAFSFRRRRNIEEFRRINEENLRANVHAAMITSSLSPVMGIIHASSIALILWYGGSLVQQGLLTIGTLMAFYGYVDMFFRPIRTLVLFFSTLQSTLAATERIFTFLDSEVEREEGEVEEPPKRGEVEFRRVTFGYEEGVPVLREVSFKVNPGERVALVGPTGAGKTTLVNLLLRFYEPWSGEILIDGVDVRRYKLSALRGAIVMVPQEPVLMSGTILDNILLANPRATVEEVELALRTLGLEELIKSLPEGLHTRVLEGGKNLSVGQRQVISFVRALLANPCILVLDEATSSVDPYTEAKLQAALNKLARGRTTIIIAHRLQTVVNADRIVVLQDGRVVEEGTHDELLRREGIYAKLYGLQMSSVPR